ncbi:MAG: ATP-binding cassette domain-containing protein, partial [Actinomycetota bacterium]
MPDATSPLLEVRNLDVSFRTESGVVHAVDGLSFSLALGEVLGIVGESGSGKTVSMMAVMRLIRDPNAIIKGEVIHRGRDLLKLSPGEMRAVRGGEIAMIFQDPMTALTPVYTVGWQIAEQLRAHEELTKKQAR